MPCALFMDNSLTTTLDHGGCRQVRTTVCVCDPAQVGPDDVMQLESNLLPFKNSMALGEDSTHTVADKSFYASGYDSRQRYGLLGSLGARAINTFWNKGGFNG